MASLSRRIFVVGVGMTKFARPQTRPNVDYPDLARESVDKALKDCGLPFKSLQAGVAGYCYGDPTSGQRAIYENGMTGMPIINVNNNCSTGSTALYIARALALGLHDCVLAVGFEKMERGLTRSFQDREFPAQKHMDRLVDLGAPKKMMEGVNAFTEDVIKMFAYAAKDHMKQYGVTKDQLGKIAFKNHRQATQNPYAMIGKEIPLETILNERMLIDPITSYMSSPTADGSAAAIVCTEEFVKRNKLEKKAVEIRAQAMETDTDSFDSFRGICGVTMAERAASQVFRDSKLTPQDVDVLEVHDCFSINELMMYEALGLVPVGKGGAMVDSGEWQTNKNGGQLFVMGKNMRRKSDSGMGGWVVNPSGGLEGKGHPIGASGLAQCAELVWQLRGEAEKRQVNNARVALQHNFGIGGAAVVTLYSKLDQ
eukprot:TRINITY_DN14804_c0_g1::TRINITY_DN14804_c0_g1_i1::g.30259::m.30259 TRINITY_DN14804_c0_g1::TRINITY_DN14804_c0_g1_i1::g.30259  ORF type:complete len:426 (+),score=63.00,sp/O62742/NLTP_RABIT/51.43/3e-137,Thiolase_C/PF02803.13/4.5e+03,Thiolase_C/PF02803.13/7.7e-08,Thiolase_N/PF00108.18/3.3e-05,Thiolase_N/PF00108.18/5.4e+02,ACP_syn_III/PF08545.5/0.072,ACP_syn_III/PF08545.5/1.2e+03,ACP_syn_III/PF08545.5/1.1e+03,Ketoacyl-synt_C/PF02801.17/0.97,Ketoacyl-synt_C/PF02801.17/56 TRINITY_DN14804_c0_g1_i1:80-13